MDTPTLLTKARDLIVEKGWGQGDLENGRLCVATAITRAYHILRLGLYHPEVVNAAYSRIIDIIGGVTPEGDSIDDAISQGKRTVAWNDAPGRTISDVVAMFDRAIELSRAGTT